MKKIYLFVLAAALAFAGCKSSGSLGDSFGKVYSNYAAALNLDGAETYTVQSGDTLSDISKAKYGDGNGYYFPLIMLASRDVVQDPELIEPGMELTVPNFEANINDADRAKGLSPYFKDIANVYKQKKTKNAAKTRETLLGISKELAEK